MTTTMASPKPQVSCPAVSSEESSVVQVLDSNDPLSASSSSSPSRVQVIYSSEPLVPVFPSSEQEAGCSSTATGFTAAWVTPASPTRTEDSLSDAEEPPPASGSSGRRIHYNKEEIRSHWNMRKLLKMLDTTERCIAFAEERNLIPREKMCRYHKKNMIISQTYGTGPLGAFRCRKGTCRDKSHSRAKGTWFENVRLPLDMMFEVMYMFSQKYSYLQVQLETAREDRETVLSTRTIADWFSNCREAITLYELEHQNHQAKIGGPGKVVQIIDESKFGKRKYNGGRHIEGWVLGMIEDGSYELRLEVCPNEINEKSAEIMVPLIQKHVQEGTEIQTSTDFWSVYNCLPEHGYIYKKVNYSDPVNNFVAPDRTHTQHIESHWRNLKKIFIKDQYKGNFTDWLVEYSWRRKIKIEHKDPFEELLKAIAYVYKIE